MESAGRPPAWRFSVPAGEVAFRDGFQGPRSFDVATSLGDFVIAKGGGDAAYQLAVVVDDAHMGITHVIRGDDLAPSTPRQILLYRALGLRAPEFFHLPLVVGEDGRRLAKRHGDTRVAAYREAGVSKERIVGWLAATCGLVDAPREMNARELLPRFSLDRVPRERVVVRPGDLHPR
jgi:glutamyl-tRNA synthetase